jgi:hypothetical protein
MLRSDPNLKEFIDFVSTLQFQIVQKAEQSSTPENPQGYISYFDVKCNNLFHEEFIQKTNSYLTNISSQIEEFTGDDYQELENVNKYIISQKKYLEKGYVNQTLIQDLDTKYLHYEITDYCTPIEKPIKNESDFTDIILKSCQSLINKIESLLPEELDDEDLKDIENFKLTWNVNLNEFYVLFEKLNENGWIDLPINPKTKEINKEKFAKIMVEIFNFKLNLNTSAKNFQNQIVDSKCLDLRKQIKLDIPKITKD